MKISQIAWFREAHHGSLAGYSDVKERALPGLPEAGLTVRQI
jgi:hypothetical protein